MKNKFSWRFCKGMILFFIFLLGFLGVPFHLCGGPGLSSPIGAEENSFIQREGVIEDPSLSSWCEEVLQERKEKIKLKNKALALIRRNLRLQHLTPEHKTNLLKKLKFLHNRLSQELALLSFQIENLEEEIIRKGCPGVFL